MYWREHFVPAMKLYLLLLKKYVKYIIFAYWLPIYEMSQSQFFFICATTLSFGEVYIDVKAISGLYLNCAYYLF